MGIIRIDQQVCPTLLGCRCAHQQQPDRRLGADWAFMSTVSGMYLHAYARQAFRDL